MNKQIKFRVWNHGINKMYDVYGFNDRQIQWRDENSGLGGSFSYGKNNKNKFTLQIYTGLHDKNGKEIYEGDYFMVAGNKIYEVMFCQAECNHDWYGGTFILWLNEDVFFPFDEYAMKHGEVVGNIYENEKPFKP